MQDGKCIRMHYQTVSRHSWINLWLSDISPDGCSIIVDRKLLTADTLHTFPECSRIVWLSDSWHLFHVPGFLGMLLPPFVRWAVMLVPEPAQNA